MKHPPYIDTIGQVLIVEASNPYWRMFYDTRAIAWDNFYFLKCTQQAHFVHFGKMIFWSHFSKVTDTLGWPIFCALWVQIKKILRWPEDRYISPSISILVLRQPFPAKIWTSLFSIGGQKRPQKIISYAFFNGFRKTSHLYLEVEFICIYLS